MNPEGEEKIRKFPAQCPACCVRGPQSVLWSLVMREESAAGCPCLRASWIWDCSVFEEDAGTQTGREEGTGLLRAAESTVHLFFSPFCRSRLQPHFTDVETESRRREVRHPGLTGREWELWLQPRQGPAPRSLSIWGEGSQDPAGPPQPPAPPPGACPPPCQPALFSGITAFSFL